MPFDINVSDPWYTAIKNGKKTIEGRLHKGKFADVKKGNVFIIHESVSVEDGRKRRKLRPAMVVLVTGVVKYKSFRDYLEQEGVARTLPGLKSVEEGVRAYRKFYDEKDEKDYGVVAFHILKL